MRTALGVCDDSVRALERRLHAVIGSHVVPTRLAVARDDMLHRPLMFAAPCLGFEATLAVREPQLELLRVQQDLGRGDRARARARLDSLQRIRAATRPGELAFDFTVGEAQARAATGDSAGAIRQLDLTLTALATLSPHVVREPGMAAAVGRGMAYRAELASASGDRGTAALWAGRVLTLWRHADPSLAPTMARMRRLANATGYSPAIVRPSSVRAARRGDAGRGRR
jgi:hypothetical protein